MTTTDQLDVPHWVTVGATVAVVADRGWTSETVKSIGKRFIVTVDDKNNLSRWPATLRRSDGTWGPSYWLLPIDHPRVLLITAQGRVRRADLNLVALVGALGRTPADPILRDKVIAAAERLQQLGVELAAAQRTATEAARAFRG